MQHSSQYCHEPYCLLLILGVCASQWMLQPMLLVLILRWHLYIVIPSRADVKQYIGLPTPPAIYKIFHSCLSELMRVSILCVPRNSAPHCFEYLLDLLQVMPRVSCKASQSGHSISHARTHTHTRARARAHAHTHTCAHIVISHIIITTMFCAYQCALTVAVVLNFGGFPNCTIRQCRSDKRGA